MAHVHVKEQPQIADQHKIDVRIEFTGLELHASPESILHAVATEIANALARAKERTK